MGSGEFDTLGEDGFEDVAFVVSVFRYFSLCFVSFYSAGTQAELCNANKRF